MTLSADSIADLGYRAGWRGEALVTGTAVALAESGGNPGAVGDVALEDATWGPSIGLWQIRSLKAQRGTGGQRDELANLDPSTNARNAYAISSGGSSFRPWSTFTNGAYKTHLDEARTAATNAAGRAGGTSGTTTATNPPATGAATVTLPPIVVPYNTGTNVLEVTTTPLTIADLTFMPTQGGAIGGLLERVVSAALDLALEEEDQLTVTLSDPGLAAFGTGQVMIGMQVDLGDLVMLVTAVEVGQGPTAERVTLTIRDHGAEFLRRDRNPGITGNHSPSDVFRGAVGAYGGKTRGAMVALVEPTPEREIRKETDTNDVRQRPQTTWAQYSAYADDAGFIFSVGHGLAIFARPTFVAAALPGVIVKYRAGRPFEPAEPDYAFAPIGCPTCRRIDETTNDAGEASAYIIPHVGVDAPADITVKLPAGRASRIRPGMRLELYGLNSFDGSYLIYRVSGDLAGGADAAWTIQARTPIDPTPKAAPAAAAAAATSPTPATTGAPGIGTKQATDFVAFAQSMAGHAYVYGAEVNLNDPTPGAFDCSELVQWACARAGVSIPDGSGNQYAHCKKAGTLISIDLAAQIPGAILFRGPGGSEHVAISLGDGSRTIEARGKAYGVLNAPIAGRGWSAAAMIPDLVYQRTTVTRDLLRPGPS